jgi:hypothetical protein
MLYVPVQSLTTWMRSLQQGLFCLIKILYCNSVMQTKYNLQYSTSLTVITWFNVLLRQTSFAVCHLYTTTPAHTYPVRHAQAPYCMRPLRLDHIFGYYLIKGMIFGKNSLSIKCEFWLSLQLLFEKFLILWRNQRDIVINVKMYSCKVPVIFVRF